MANKPKTTSKQQINEEEDRLSALPDCLIIEILSRLPNTRYAIRTSTLSKRWQHLWTHVPTLIFIDSNKNKHISFIDKTLTQCSHQLKINKFKFTGSTYYGLLWYRYESQLNNFIRFAIDRNVQELYLNFDRCSNDCFVLDQSIFNTASITRLKLTGGCVLNPTRAISWNNLKTLTISYVKLNEDLIQNILSGSPLLEILILENCYGYSRLDITSKSVKNLVLSGHMDFNKDDDIIEINAPDILSLSIKGRLFLWKVLLLDGSSLVKTELDYTKGRYYLKTRKEEKEKMLEGFILKLSHVKELKIGKNCLKALSRLEAKGFVIPSNLKVS